RIRKEPLTIEEAFSDDGEKCIFNIVNINQRERELTEQPVYKREILFWRDAETQKVKWRDIRKGEDDFCWRVTYLPKVEDSNKFVMENGMRVPARVRIGAIAVDSYSNSQGGRKYGSKASAWIGLKYDSENPDGTKKAVGHLYGRPKEKDELHEQVMLAAEYYGFQVWYEHTSDDYDTYFKQRGRRKYLGVYPLSTIAPEKRDTTERHRGVPTTPYSLTKQHDAGMSYFENSCYKIDFEEILSNAKKFDPYDRTKFDAIVSFLMLLVVLSEPVAILPPPKSPLVKVYPKVQLN